MGTAVDLAKHTQALVRRFPLVADALLALVLAAAAFVSLAVTYSGIPVTDHAFSHGFTFAVIASTLALTLPLAWRRRYPFSVSIVVVVAFLIARIVVHVPEANVSLLAAWLMIYSVAVHGQRRFRTPVLIVCYIAIVAELVRELFFASLLGDVRGGDRIVHPPRAPAELGVASAPRSSSPATTPLAAHPGRRIPRRPPRCPT